MILPKNNESEIKRRIFFALWPNEKVRLKIFEAYNNSGFSQLDGREFKLDNLHLTLYFLGNVTNEQFDSALNAAAKIEFKAFDLTLDYFDIFKKPKVLWMGCSVLPSALASLYENLGRVLSEYDFVLDSRTFTPHVTLMRKLKQYEFDITPPVINWRVNEFGLIESVVSENAVTYKPIKFFSCSAVQGGL